MPETPDQRYKYFYTAALTSLGSHVRGSTFNALQINEFAKLLATEMNSRSTSPGNNAIRDRDELAASAMINTIFATQGGTLTVEKLADRSYIIADAALLTWLL